MTFSKCNLLVCIAACGFLILGRFSGFLLWYWIPLVLLTLMQMQTQSRETALRSNPAWLLLLACLCLTPDLSDDVHRYLWEGYVQTQGYSPYQHSPESLYEVLDHPSEGLVNNGDLTAIYPPLAQYLFRLAATLSATLVGWKLLLASLLLFFLFHPVGRASFPWLFAPLVLFEGFWNSHLDLLGLVPGFLLVAALRDKKPFAVGFCLALMTAFKLLPVLLLPTCMLYFKRGSWPRLLLGFFPFLILTYLPYLSQGMALFDSFLTFSRHWHFNNLLFPLFDAVLPPDGVRPALAICLIITIVAVTLSKRDVVDRCAFIWIALFVFSPTFFPWYLIWLVPFIQSGKQAFLHLAYAASFFSYLILIPYRASGVWAEHWAWLLPEWLVLYACFYAICRRTR